MSVPLDPFQATNLLGSAWPFQPQSIWELGPSLPHIEASEYAPFTTSEVRSPKGKAAVKIPRWSFAPLVDRYNREERLQMDALQRRAPTKWMLEGKPPKGGRSQYLQSAHAISGSSTGESLKVLTKADMAYRRSKRKALVAYRNKIHDWIQAEKAAREATATARKKWPLKKLVERGLAISNLQAYLLSDSTRHFGKRVAVFRKIGAQKFGWSKMRPGDAVIITPQETTSREQEDHAIQGTIIDKTATRMRVAFEDRTGGMDIEGVPVWRMDQGHNDIFERRIDHALEAIEHDVDFLEMVSMEGAELCLSGCKVLDALLGISQPPARTDAQTFSESDKFCEWLTRSSRESYNPLAHDPGASLNQCQRDAIKVMLSSRVSLIQGPPGTGKTKTIAEAVKALKADFKVKEPILLTAHTNVAVDNLTEGAARVGLNVVRAGASAKTRPELRKYSLEALAESHVLMPELRELRSHIAKLQGLLGLSFDDSDSDDAFTWREAPAPSGTQTVETLSPEQQASIRRKLARCYQRSYAVWQRITRTVLLDADVICATAVSACSNDLMQIDFPVVFFDEGSMATEPTSLIPLVKGCRHLAIIGDHKQLPPVVASIEARVQGLGISLFERLIEEGIHPRTMLTEQYRMHPLIAEFPNQAFYKGLLVNAPATKELAPIKSQFLPDSSSHLGFVNHSHQERKVDDSIENRGEAKMVLECVADVLLKNPDLQGSDIGIVTPYLSQVVHLESVLRQEAEVHDSVLARRLGPRVSCLEDVEVNTVDGFEGREKAVILFSTVRCNPQGYVGFLADARRLNVALTRARRGLIVFGDAQTLANCKVGEVGKQTVVPEDIKALQSYVEYVTEKRLMINQAAFA